MREALYAHPMIVDDCRARLIGIPAFGVAIPLVFDLYGTRSARDGLVWIGALVFLALSAAIWQGNRWLLLRSRGTMDWLERPARRLLVLVGGIVLYTAPLTIAVMLGWQHLSGVTVDVRAVALANVICVVFVAHAYETVLLIKDRESDLVRVADTERLRAEAELLALRRQVDPHFIFNCLNTLQHLIDEDPTRAKRFNRDLAAVTRYLLQTSDCFTVPLADELDFARRFAGLLAIRFGDAFRVEIVVADDVDLGVGVPPTALQLLIENAAKHNVFHARAPLTVTVAVSADRVVVRHARAATRPSTGAGLGLANLAERVRRATGRTLDVDDGDGAFVVVVPLATGAS